MQLALRRQWRQHELPEWTAWNQALAMIWLVGSPAVREAAKQMDRVFWLCGAGSNSGHVADEESRAGQRDAMEQSRRDFINAARCEPVGSRGSRRPSTSRRRVTTRRHSTSSAANSRNFSARPRFDADAGEPILASRLLSADPLAAHTTRSPSVTNPLPRSAPRWRVRPRRSNCRIARALTAPTRTSASRSRRSSDRIRRAGGRYRETSPIAPRVTLSDEEDQGDAHRAAVLELSEEATWPIGTSS
jgi:hypothetical protein